MLIVPDTNVYISGAAIAAGHSSQIMDLWCEGKLEIALSEPILSEIRKVLLYPKIATRTGWNEKKVNNYIETLRASTIIVPGTTPVHVSPDPDDDKFFAAAVEAGADYIVSGDQHHVLSIPSYKNILTISPKDFIEKVLQSTR